VKVALVRPVPGEADSRHARFRHSGPPTPLDIEPVLHDESAVSLEVAVFGYTKDLPAL
jgi:hypothetical protein